MISSDVILDFIGMLLVMKIIELYLFSVCVNVSVKLVSSVGSMVGSMMWWNVS